MPQKMRHQKPKRKMNQPVGATSVRADGIKYIKIRMDGPSNQRWMQYARWLWEAVHGPVPEGKRVLHSDGNVANDSIQNLMLGTPGDALWIHCHCDKKKSERSYRRARKGCIRMNVERGKFNRGLNWLPTYFYAVNVDTERAWNSPARSATAVCRQLGIDPDGRRIWPQILGYPNGNRAEAITVRCLGTDWKTFADLHAAVTEFANRIGFKPMKKGTLYSAISRLQKRGHIDGRRGHYRLTIERPWPLAVVRGSQIMKQFPRCSRLNSIEELGCAFSSMDVIT